MPSDTFELVNISYQYLYFLFDAKFTLPGFPQRTVPRFWHQ
jgi:hypothetical protein